MADHYFNPTDICPESRELLEHSTIITVRCGKCRKLNPNFNSPQPQTSAFPSHLPDRRNQTKSLPVEHEVIVVDDSPGASAGPASSTSTALIPAARRRAHATSIPSLPNFKLGYAETERQHVNQIVAERKPRTNFAMSTPTVHFTIMVAHFTWDLAIVDDLGFWTAANNQWSIDENNRHVTYEDLLASILAQAMSQTSRSNVKKWLEPQVKEGKWCLGHTNPSKSGTQSRDIVTWDVPRLLSSVIDSGPYEQKPVTGTARKLVTLWLYWTPEQPPLESFVEASPQKPKREKAMGKKESKGEKASRKNNKVSGVKVESVGTTKHARPISGEISASKRSIGAVTRGQAARTTSVPFKKEESDTEFVPVEDLLKYGKRVGDEEVEVAGSDDMDGDQDKAEIL